MSGRSFAGSRSAGRRRLALLFPSADPPDRGRRGAAARWGAGGLAGLACGLLVGGVPGLACGAVLGLLCGRWLGRLEPRAVRARRARLVADIPIAVDLLAACLRGGMPWGGAVSAVAEAVGGPLGEELHGVAGQVRLGAEPSAAWAALAAEPALAVLARTIARAAGSGAPLAPALTRLARDQRRAARAAGEARARAAGILAVAPLGLCFLPAFVLLGIVPAIAGIAATLQSP